MKLKLETNDIFHCPEGQWSGICEAIEEPKKRINQPCEKQVRLRFRITADDGHDYIVGKTFCAELRPGTELYGYLESWLDGDFEKVLDDNGEVDLDLLVTKAADFLITHIHNRNHDHPFVNIAAICPFGRLTE